MFALSLLQVGLTLDESKYSTVSSTLFYASIILIGIATFIVAKAIFSEEEKFKASETLQEADSGVKKSSLGFVFKYSQPFVKRYVSQAVGSMKNKQQIKNKYKRKLANAGVTQEMTPEDFYSYKLFLILGFPIVFLGARQFMEADWPLTLVPVVSLVGFYYPEIWLNGKIERRKKEILMNMPFIVDMLALSVEAGLDFMAAMVKVVEKAPKSALSEEFETAIKEIKIGSSRAEALRNLSWRTDVLPIASFCATLIAADSVGASIGPILKTLSGEIRQKRSASIEEQAATASTKILIPLMFFILPSVILIVFAPFVIEMMASGGSGP
jgi:tight adherence protein C